MWNKGWQSRWARKKGAVIRLQNDNKLLSLASFSACAFSQLYQNLVLKNTVSILF